VYVNSTNSDLDLSRGMLSKQLLKLMGQKLQDQCNEYAPLAIGKVAVTSAEKMFCNVILHVNLPSYGAKGSQRGFREAMQNILQICLDQSLTSIAIPSLGTGKLGYPHHLVANVVISEVLGFNEKHPKFFKKVVLVLSERDVYEKCMKIYAEKLLTSTSEKVHTVEKATTGDKGSAMLYVQCRGIEDDVFDVIINPISSVLDSNPLVQVLSKKAGETLQILCSQLVESLIVVDEKKSVFTKPSGKLRCKKLLHVYNPNTNECNTDALCTVVLNALSLAEQEQYRSLCLPMFGSGYPLEEMASKLIQACLEFGQKAPVYLKKIVLVTAEECDYDKVCSCLSNIKARSKMSVDPAPVHTMNLQQWSWRQTKRRSLHPWDMKDFKMLKNKDAVIDVYCCMAQQGVSVIHDIESELMKRLVTDYIEDDHIHYLIASELSDIRCYAGQIGVAVSLTKQRNRVTLSGEKIGVEVAKTHITNVLASLKHTKTLLNQVAWQRVTDSGIETIGEEISFQLESARMKDIQWMKVNCGVYCSVIDFKNMLEIDISSGKTCSIRRIDKPNIALPKFWQPLPLENGAEKACHLFTVPSGTEEYESVVKEFGETMYGKRCIIVKLERIQNFNEYSKHCAFLDVLKRKYGGGVLLKRLFHGTSSASIEAIAHQGFNRIFAADANAAVFGKGVYFAGRSNYSAQEKYSVPDEHGNQKMFICRVVVGKYTKGEKTMKVAPPFDPSRNKHLLFDTLVDNVTNPTIYVVMSDSQAYPEYVVTFRTH
jgi:poly [ADP-ribose] polymerase 10/14/15